MDKWANREAHPPVIGGPAGWAMFLSFFRDQAGVLTKTRARYGKIAVVEKWVPLRKKKRRFVIVSGAEHNRVVLSDTETYHSSGPLMRGPDGSLVNAFRRGLIGINGQKHTDHRRMVSSLLIPRAIQQYYGQMVQIVDRTLQEWPNGSTVDVSQQISQLSLYVSASNLLGGGEDDQVLKTASLVRNVMRQCSSLPVVLAPFDIGFTPYSRLLKNARVLDGRLQDMLRRRENDTDPGSGLIEQMIAYRREHPDKLSESELKEHAVVLFTASHETTARAVIWTLFLLSQHPSHMAQVHQELRSQCGDQLPLPSDLSQMKWLDATIKESMRLFPPVTWVSRRIQSETNLGGVSLGPGDSVILNHLMTHREPDVFDSPLKFRPNRWMNQHPDRYEYLPFSSGPRTCIGKALGEISIKLIVAMALQRFKFTMADNARIDRAVHITLAPQKGLPMIVEPNDGKFCSVPVRGNVHQMVDLSETGPRHIDSARLPHAAFSNPTRNDSDSTNAAQAAAAGCPFHANAADPAKKAPVVTLERVTIRADRPAEYRDRNMNEESQSKPDAA